MSDARVAHQFVWMLRYAASRDVGGRGRCDEALDARADGHGDHVALETFVVADAGIEEEILPTLRELGIGVTACGVLSRGLISGHWSKDSAGKGDFRAMSPRFQGDNLDHNLALVDALRKVADAKGVSVAQIAIAWVAAQGSDIVPLVGARRRDRLAEALGAVDVTLTAEDLAAIAQAVPNGAAAGERYAAAQMAHLDSEKGSHGHAA